MACLDGAGAPSAVKGSDMPTTIWIGLGGFLGVNARCWLGLWLASRRGAGFPIGTLVANALGNFVLAFLLTLAASRVFVPPGVHRFLSVSVLGGFTTFSSFSYETIILLEQEGRITALVSLLTNVLLGLLGALLGVVAARCLQRVG